MKYVRIVAVTKIRKARQDRNGTDQLKVLKIRIINVSEEFVFQLNLVNTKM